MPACQSRGAGNFGRRGPAAQMPGQLETLVAPSRFAAAAAAPPHECSILHHGNCRDASRQFTSIQAIAASRQLPWAAVAAPPHDSDSPAARPSLAGRFKAGRGTGNPPFISRYTKI